MDIKLAAMIGPYEVNQTQVEYVRQSGFSLRVLDLNTMEIAVIDDKVQTQIGLAYSIGYVRPFFEWISPDEIIYQNMKPVDRNEAEYVLKCANIKDKTTTEWLTTKTRLKTGGGNMSCDWFTGQIYFQDYLLDIKNKELLPKVQITLLKETSK